MYETDCASVRQESIKDNSVLKNIFYLWPGEGHNFFVSVQGQGHNFLGALFKNLVVPPPRPPLNNDTSLITTKI